MSNALLSPPRSGSSSTAPLQGAPRLAPRDRPLFERVFSLLDASQADPILADIRDRIAFQLWRRSKPDCLPLIRWMNASIEEDGVAPGSLHAASVERLFAERGVEEGSSDAEILQGWLSGPCRWMAADRAAYVLAISERPCLSREQLALQREVLAAPSSQSPGVASSSGSSHYVEPEQEALISKTSPVHRPSPQHTGSAIEVLDWLSEAPEADREGIKRSLKELGALWHRLPPQPSQIPDVMRQFARRPELLTPLLALMLESLPGAISQAFPEVWSLAERRFPQHSQCHLLERLAEQMLRHRLPEGLVEQIADWIDPETASRQVIERLTKAGIWRSSWFEAHQESLLSSSGLQSLLPLWARGRISAPERDQMLQAAIAWETEHPSHHPSRLLAILAFNQPEAPWDPQSVAAALAVLRRSPREMQACLQACWERKVLSAELELLVLQEALLSQDWRQALLDSPQCIDGVLASKAWEALLARGSSSERRVCCELFLAVAQAGSCSGARSDAVAKRLATLFLRNASQVHESVEVMAACAPPFSLELLAALLTGSHRLLSQAHAALWRLAFRLLTGPQLDSLLLRDTRRVAGEWFGAEGSPFRGRLSLVWEGALRAAEGSLGCEGDCIRLPSVAQTLAFACGVSVEAKRRTRGPCLWPSVMIGPMVTFGDQPDHQAERLILMLLASEDLQQHPWSLLRTDKRAPQFLKLLVDDLQRSAIPSAVLQEITARFEGFDWQGVSPPQRERCRQAVSRYAVLVMQKIISSVSGAIRSGAGCGTSSSSKLCDDAVRAVIRDTGDLQLMLKTLGELGSDSIPSLLRSLDVAEPVQVSGLQRRLLEVLFRNRVMEWSRISRNGGFELFRCWRAELHQSFKAPSEIPMLWQEVVEWVLSQPEQELPSAASEALNWLGDFRLPLVEDLQDVQQIIASMERLLPPVMAAAARLQATARREQLYADLTAGMLALPLGLLDRQYGEQVAAEIRGYCRRLLQAGYPQGNLPMQDLLATLTLLEAREGTLAIDDPLSPSSYLKLWQWEEHGGEAERGSSVVMQLGLLQQASFEFARTGELAARALLVATLARTLDVSLGSKINFGDPMAALPPGVGMRLALLADAFSLLNGRRPLLGLCGKIHPRVRSFLKALDDVSLSTLQELATSILTECREEPWTLARSLLFTMGAESAGVLEAEIPAHKAHNRIFMVAELVKPLENAGLNRSLKEWLQDPRAITRSKAAAWIGMIGIEAQRKRKKQAPGRS